MRGKCSKCMKQKELTKHSLIGSHQPPFILVCRYCHDLIHEMRRTIKLNRKYQRGTPKNKKKYIP